MCRISNFGEWLIRLVGGASVVRASPAFVAK